MECTEDILIKREPPFYIITFNRPKRKNALTSQMFRKFQECLKLAAEDDEISMLVVTGVGDYFTSGNDLKNFLDATGGEGFSLEKAAKEGRDGFHEFVRLLIDFPKILVAIINGHSIGIGVTMLGLFDLVYASDRATFLAPFASIGQVPEGCSSYVFPKLMGYGKATEMLVFGKKIDASEALSCGLVTRVFPHNELNECWTLLKQYTSIPIHSAISSRNMMRIHEKEYLHQVNTRECDTLYNCWTSDKFFDVIMKFFNRKSKL